MKYTYINLRGEIEVLTMKEITRRSGNKISWERMHSIDKHKCVVVDGKNKYKDFLEKYRIPLTIFNFNNIVEWGHLQLYPHWVNIALENGAIDKREEVRK